MNLHTCLKLYTNKGNFTIIFFQLKMWMGVTSKEKKNSSWLENKTQLHSIETHFKQSDSEKPKLKVCGAVKRELLCWLMAIVFKKIKIN